MKKPSKPTKMVCSISGLTISTLLTHNHPPGLKHDPANAQLQEGVRAASQEMRSAAGGGMFGADFMTRLAMHPETRPFLSQPDFMAIIAELQTSPQAMGKHMNDPRLLKALEVALGLKVATPEETAANGHAQDASEVTPMEVAGCGVIGCCGGAAALLHR